MTVNRSVPGNHNEQLQIIELSGPTMQRTKLTASSHYIYHMFDADLQYIHCRY